MPSWKAFALLSRPKGRLGERGQQRGSGLSPGPLASWRGFICKVALRDPWKFLKDLGIQILVRSWANLFSLCSDLAFFTGPGGLKEMAAGVLGLGVQKEQGLAGLCPVIYGHSLFCSATL